MKKILKLVLGLLLVGSMLFGGTTLPTTSTFGINVTVPAVHEIKIADGNTITPAGLTVGGFNAVPSLTRIAISYETLTSQQLYLLVKTNNRIRLKVQANIQPLVADTISSVPATTKINYTMLGNTSVDNDSYVDLIEYEVSVSGMRVFNTAFTIVLNSTETANAAAGVYSALITFRLIAD